MSDRTQVTINGELQSVEGRPTIHELVVELGMNPEVVAVERNLAIVKRDRFDTVQVEPGDRIEIVEFVGGG